MTRPSKRFWTIVACVGAVACGSDRPSPEDVARRTVETLESIPDLEQRAAVSALALNTLCTLGRLGGGEAEGRVETALARMIEDQPPELVSQLAAYGETLSRVSTVDRTRLLGDLASFDPGQCDSPPDWDRLRYGIIFNHQLIPRLRTNFCSNNLTYADGTVADRAITAGSVLHAIQPDPEGGPELRRFLPLATPALIGIERSEFVRARHPGLAATADDGEGISPYGFATNIQCSAANPCDASLGMLCNTVFGGAVGRCVAYPVVQKDQTMVLRGYNFWDVAESRVVFDPVVPGQGTESTTIVSIVDPNEPTDSAAACPLPSLSNPTHNRAHFRVTANEGAFYRVRMFNHNGQFLTQQDGLDDADSRVIHTCYPPPGPERDDVPPGTIRDCTFPQETCEQDGATCGATWAVPPRQLDECRHLPGETPPCGETPEWYEAQPLSPRGDGVAFREEAIVFVEAEAPVFELSGILHAIEVQEETGVDFLGSDEPLIGIVGGDLTTTPDPDNLAQRFLGSDYDEGERKIEDFPLTTVEVPADGNAVLLAFMFEDDGFVAAFAAGALAIAVAAAIIVLSGGAGALAAAGGGSGAVLVWGLLVGQFHQPDDLIAMDPFSATPAEVRERIGVSHADDFLTTVPALVGGLPEVDSPIRSGVTRSQVIHPFEEFRVADEPLQAECNPGSCGSGEVCLVNRCVPSDFSDPTAGTAFRERRTYLGGGGRYAVDYEWRLQEK